MGKDFIIIGAGLSGLRAASLIQSLKLGSVLIVEKSRGVGGRMAARRTLSTRFDHGAQFYRLKKDIAELHQGWSQEQLSASWFHSEQGEHWCARTGMTTLAKSMTNGLEIGLEKQISKIIFENGQWTIVSDKNEKWNCHNLIVSSPLPQTVKLLEETSRLNGFDNPKYLQLKKIEYTKALIALITLKDQWSINNHGYEEFDSGDFFSIADQKKKGVSEINAHTLTMSADFSEENFELSDDVILSKILSSFSSQYTGIAIEEAELKKWRYCKPKTQDQNLFCEMAPNLYLIGDAFGGSSLLGAVRSAEALCLHLKNKV